MRCGNCLQGFRKISTGSHALRFFASLMVFPTVSEMITFTLNLISGDDELFHLARSFDWKAILGMLAEL